MSTKGIPNSGGITYTKEWNTERFGEQRTIWKLTKSKQWTQSLRSILPCKIFHRKRFLRHRCSSKKVNDWMYIKCEGQFLRKIKLKAGKWLLKWNRKEECFFKETLQKQNEWKLVSYQSNYRISTPKWNQWRPTSERKQGEFTDGHFSYSNHISQEHQLEGEKLDFKAHNPFLL